MLLAAGHNWQYGLGAGRWGSALAAIGLIHAGAAFAALMVWERFTPPIPPAAALMIEMQPAPVAPPAPELVAPQEPESAPEPEPEPRAEDPAPVPPIPEVAPVMPAPEVVLPPKPAPNKPQKDDLVKRELPREKPKPKPEPKPEKPRPEKPKRETPTAVDDQQAPPPQPAQQTASVAAAPARPAPKPAAPSAAELAAVASAKASWEGILMAHLKKHQRYPKSAKRRNVEGTPHVRFTMDRSGRVLNFALVASSGSEALDEEALELIQRAQPLPAFLPEMTQPTLELTIPVQFRLD